MKRFFYQGHNLAYRDEGTGNVVIMVHGTPSSSAEFEEVIGGLKNEYRCIAIDHLGFGSSDKPVDGDYRLSKHTERLTALLDHLAIDQFHLILHDFGGPIALPIALQRWDKLQSVTLMNTWAWPLEETEPPLKKQKRLLSSRLMEWLYLRLNFSARVLVKMGWGSHRPLSRAKHKAYRSPFRSPADRLGTVAFLKALVDREDPAWHVNEDLPKLASKATLILWGVSDKLITESTLERWISILPQARVKTFPDVGHFVADEAPDLVIPELRQFLAGRS